MYSDSTVNAPGHSRGKHAQPTGASLGARCLWQVLLLALLLVRSSPAAAEVLYSKEAALALAFPGATRVETKTLFLTAAQKEQVQTQAQAPVVSQLVSYFVGWQETRLVGVAFLDTHVVRSMPETFMVVVTPEGVIRDTFILAFHEPAEYRPSERWLNQLDGKRLGPELQVKRQLAGIAGATLSAHALTAGVRRVLASFEVAVKPQLGSSTALKP